MNKKTQDYTQPSACLCCGKGLFKKVLQLNDQPLANSYCKIPNQYEKIYGLGLDYCTSCTHLQLPFIVNPDLLFKNYLYVSGTSNTLRAYFKEFVGIVQKYQEGKKVLDIACNDGSQLDAFKVEGYETHGVDPAENLYPLSSKNHKVFCGYFSEAALGNLDSDYNVIIAQNVFAHVDDPLWFLEGCKKILATGGHIFIQTSQANMVENNEFDTIYHEHISFFSAKSFCTLARRAGLKVIDIFKTNVHGTSYVFVLSNTGEDRTVELLKNEKTRTYEDMIAYSLSVKRIAETSNLKVKVYRELGYKIIGYGAAAKGNTFINFANLDLDYIVDDNPLKQGLYTPGKKILIKSPEELKYEDNKILMIPLAWNFFDEIKQKTLDLVSCKIKFLRYFPKVEILDA